VGLSALSNILMATKVHSPTEQCEALTRHWLFASMLKPIILDKGVLSAHNHLAVYCDEIAKLAKVDESVDWKEVNRCYPTQ
jgi:hypothetical protein